MRTPIVVRAIFDPEARVWLTQSDDIFGLRIEAATFEELFGRIPGAIQDLLECAGETDALVPFELVAHASSSVQLGAAA